MRAREDLVDPDELQLMDQCNRNWIQAWRNATARSDAVKAVVTSHRTSRRRIVREISVL